MIEDTQQLHLQFLEPIPQEGATLHMEFTYTMSQDMSGFYSSNHEGRCRYSGPDHRH